MALLSYSGSIKRLNKDLSYHVVEQHPPVTVLYTYIYVVTNELIMERTHINFLVADKLIVQQHPPDFVHIYIYIYIFII
jgi:hypothetical protein